MEDIDGGLHPAVDGQSLDEDDDERREGGGWVCVCVCVCVCVGGGGVVVVGAFKTYKGLAEECSRSAMKAHKQCCFLVFCRDPETCKADRMPDLFRQVHVLPCPNETEVPTLYSILTLGHQIPAVTLERQVPCRAATRVSFV